MASEITECDLENPGTCDCATKNNFTTYTFMLGETQRCFTVYSPPTEDLTPQPVNIRSIFD